MKRQYFWYYRVFVGGKLVKVYKSKRYFDKFVKHLIDNRIDYSFSIVANY